MVLVSAAEQIERLVQGLAAAGLSVVNDYNGSDRPVTLIVRDGERLEELRVFCWNVTSGGRGRRETEHRVQTTRPGDVRLLVADGPLTLVLGYFEELDVFAAWDARQHPNPGGSSSLQIPQAKLREAAETGFAAHERPLGQHGAMEVVVAFRPELIGTYLEIIPNLDVSAAQDATATAAAASGEERPLEELPDNERRRVLRSISIAVRNGQFRSSVLRAYEGRCAFCGINAYLPQAAHIKPVYFSGADQIRNGVAACPTHHEALDRGLILIDDDYSLRLNEAKLHEMGVSVSDVDELRAPLGTRLRLPADPELRPAPENLQAHRGGVPASG